MVVITINLHNSRSSPRLLPLDGSASLLNGFEVSKCLVWITIINNSEHDSKKIEEILHFLKPCISKHAKCTYVWMGLHTCAAPSPNGSHTVCHEPKLVSFLREHKENWMRWVSFPCTECRLLASGSQKINQPCAKYAPHANGTAHKRRTRVYKV